jgi:hypothetical protein
VTTCWLTSIIRTGLRAFSKTTTSRELPPNFLGHSTRRRLSSLSSRPACVFFHQGQLEGARIRVPVHLRRGPVEPADPPLAAFYARLLAVLKETDALRNGNWSLIDPQPAWPGNGTADGFIAFVWAGEHSSRYVVVINYAGTRGQCRLPLPFPDLQGKQVRLADLMGSEIYDRDGSELVDTGLYIDHTSWRFNVFELQTM